MVEKIDFVGEYPFLFFFREVFFFIGKVLNSLLGRLIKPGAVEVNVYLREA